MPRKSLLLLTLLLILFSCSDRGIIKKEELPPLIADLFIADKALSMDFQRMQSADTMAIYEPVLKKYGYTTEEFLATIDHYLPRPAKLKGFFTKAMEILEKRKALAEEQIIEAEIKSFVLKDVLLSIRERDSLKKTDLHIRALRWIIAPDSFPKSPFFLPDSLYERVEYPGMAIWWKNNTQIENSPFYKYEKDSRTISLSPRQATDKDGLSLPEH